MKKKRKQDNDDNVVSAEIKRTLSVRASFTKDQIKIFRFLTNESKKIFNHYMFCLNFYNSFKHQIFDDIMAMHINGDLTNDNINDCISSRTQFYYDFYSSNYMQYKINNNIIYSIIKQMNIIVTDTNLDELNKSIIDKCILNKNIVFDSSNADFLFYDIIKNILTTFYMNNYFSVRNSLLYKRKIKEHLLISSFIEHVTKKKLKYSNDTLFAPTTCKQLSTLYENMNSQQNIIRKLALKKLTNNKIYNDTVINIMDHAYKSYMSYVGLRLKGKYAKRPKFKSEKEKYILPLYSKSFKIVDGQIRVCLGKYVDANYNDICKTKYKTIKKQQTYTLYESDKKAFKGSFTYINLPKHINGTSIKLISICPKYDGHKFVVNYTYNRQSVERKYNKNDNVSIDLGMGNLMTIYDPNGKQVLIKGGPLIQMNENYNKKIGNLQSAMSKCGHYIGNRIRNLFIKRENKINNCFNLIVKKIYELYKEKDKIIIGYNTSWKTNVDMGTNNNRKFYQIPYRKLINKIRDKFGEHLIEIGEAYTSKTDSLAKEPIEKQENYLGERIKRGLFSSSKGKLINADLNGAINIMRLYMKKYEECDLEEIKGIHLYNPKTIKAYEV